MSLLIGMLYILIGVSLILLVIMLPLYAFVLARHFDPYFPKFVKSKESFESGWWVLNPVMRGTRYMGLMMFKKAWSRPYNQYFFGGFDFRKHARKSDWAVLYTAMIAFWSGGAFSIALFIALQY